jgi:hypothetical protein
MMDVLQCNILQQILAILDGLVPYSKDIEQTTTHSIAGSNEGKFETFIISSFMWE